MTNCETQVDYDQGILGMPLMRLLLISKRSNDTASTALHLHWSEAESKKKKGPFRGFYCVGCVFVLCYPRANREGSILAMALFVRTTTLFYMIKKINDL